MPAQPTRRPRRPPQAPGIARNVMIGMWLLGAALLFAMLFSIVAVSREPPPAGERPDRLSKATLARLEDPQTRAATVMDLGLRRVGKSLSALAELLDDPDPSFRALCVRTIGRLDRPQGVAALKPCIADPDLNVRLACVQALADLYGYEAYRALAEMTRDPAPLVRGAAVQVLGRHIEEKQALTRVLGALSDSEEAVRETALAALIGAEADIVVRGLTAALYVADKATRPRVVDALLALVGPQTWSGLCHALLHHDQAVRSRVADAVAAAGPRILPTLSAAIARRTETTGDSLDCAVRLDVARVAAALQSPASARLLIELLSGAPCAGDESEALARAVREALLALGEDALPALRDRLLRAGRAEPDADALTHGICVQLGRPAAEVIAGHLAERSFYLHPDRLKRWVRLLGEIGDPAALPALRRALAHDIAGIEAEVASAWEEIGRNAGSGLPECTVDPQEAAALHKTVRSLDLDFGRAVPATEPAGGLPDDGVVLLTLEGGLLRPPMNVPLDLDIELFRRDGRWHPDFWARSRRYNARHHPGRLRARQRLPGAVELELRLAVLDDAAVPGGGAEYSIELPAALDGAETAGYRGHHNFQPVAGTVRIEYRAGRVRLPREAAAVAGRHPRLLFGDADVPVLRARAKTEVGRRILQALEGKVGRVKPNAVPPATRAGRSRTLRRGRSAARRHSPAEALMLTGRPPPAHLRPVRSVDPFGWARQVERLVGRALLAMVYNDRRTGRAVGREMISLARVMPHGGQHGETQTPGLRILGYGYDMAYPYMSAAEREEATRRLCHFWNWAHPEGPVTSGGPGQWTMFLSGICAMLRERGPMDVPRPEREAVLAFVEPPLRSPGRDGVPVNPVRPDALLSRWLYAATAAHAPGAADPLAQLGGPAAAAPAEGQALEGPAGPVVFRRLPERALAPAAGLGRKDRLLRLPIRERGEVCYLYALIEAGDRSILTLDCGLPMGYAGCDIWIDGRAVADGAVLAIAPGLHRIMLRVKGRLVSPFLFAGDSALRAGYALRHEVLIDEWNKEESHWQTTGERPSTWRYFIRGSRAVQRTLRRAERDVRDNGVYRRIDAMALAGYQRAAGEPLARDMRLPFSPELLPRVWDQVSDEQLCFAMHLAEPACKPWLAWEFNRRYLPDGLHRLPPHCLAAAFVTYPMDVQPAPPPFLAP